MSEVSVQFLGTGDVFGSGVRDQTCIFVDANGFRFLLDCGASSLISMKRWGVAPGDIDAILLTHLHGDHFGGLPFIMLEAQLISKRERDLLVAGPPGTEQRVLAAMEVFFPGSTGIKRKFETRFLELPDARASSVGPLEVTPSTVVHASGAPAYALRVGCAGRVITYSGDTEWTDALLSAAEGADLFICEAYFFEKKIKYHLDFKTLMAHVGELQASRLVATHMSEDMLARLPQLDVEAAHDGMRIVL